MKSIRMALYFAVIFAFFSGCQKKADLSVDEIHQRRLLVMVTGKPDAYCWTMAGQLGASAAFGLVGLAVSGISANEKGKNFDECMSGYDIKGKIFAALLNELEKIDHETLPVNNYLDEDTDNGYPVLSSVDQLKREYPGDIILIVSPCEWGLRNQKPYIALVYSLYDIDSGGLILKYSDSIKNEDIHVPQKNMKEWKQDTEALFSAIDEQIETLAKRIAESVEKGEVPEVEVVWVYIGGIPPKLNTLFKKETSTNTTP